MLKSLPLKSSLACAPGSLANYNTLWWSTWLMCCIVIGCAAWHTPERKPNSCNLMPYPCSHFYFDINFGNRSYKWYLGFWSSKLIFEVTKIDLHFRSSKSESWSILHLQNWSSIIFQSSYCSLAFYQKVVFRLCLLWNLKTSF